MTSELVIAILGIKLAVIAMVFSLALAAIPLSLELLSAGSKIRKFFVIFSLGIHLLLATDLFIAVLMIKIPS